MFERVLYTRLKSKIAEMRKKPALLRRALWAPGWEGGELDTLVDYFLTQGEPPIIHAYARSGASFPCYAIVLESESGGAQRYLGEDPAILTDEEQLIAEIEAERDNVVDLGAERWSFNYGIFTYAEQPDVALAYHNVLRSIFSESQAWLLARGFEEPVYGGQDLAPDPRYLPENTYARKFSIQGHAHVLFGRDTDLGPLASGRGKTVRGIHVAGTANVEALVTPADE